MSHKSKPSKIKAWNKNDRGERLCSCPFVIKDDNTVDIFKAKKEIKSMKHTLCKDCITRKGQAYRDR